MLFTAVFTVAFAAFATAAPSPAPFPAADLETRDTGSCKYTSDIVKWYTVRVDSAQDDGLCDGFWANLRPHCSPGRPTCTQVGSVKVLQFTTEITCPDSRVQDTIWIATSPNLGGVTCEKV